MPHNLEFKRIVDLDPATIYKAWTTPELIVQWFAPQPWTTEQCIIEPYAGGWFHTVMRSPEGQSVANDGCILEAIPNQRLVWTTALTKDFRPTQNPFMTAIISLTPCEEGTVYTATVMHPTAELLQQHQAMGFDQGWSQCLHQLVELMKSR